MTEIHRVRHYLQWMYAKFQENILKKHPQVLNFEKCIFSGHLLSICYLATKFKHYRARSFSV